MNRKSLKPMLLDAPPATYRKKTNVAAVVAITLMFALVPAVQANGDDFGSVVRMIEQFYHVKHEGIPFLARASMKAATTAARIKGGTAKQIAEAGSIKLAIFQDQEFNSAGRFAKFRSSLNSALAQSWTPFVQTLSAKDEVQTYIFLRNAGDNFHVLVITIEQREATVVQVTLSPKNLALLMQDPNGMGRAITEDATTTDPE
jgi:hypothetical protein